MGNNLSACACGQKDDIPAKEKHPTVKGIDNGDKPKIKKRSLLKKRKKNKDKKKENDENDPAVDLRSSNNDVKDIIHIEVEREPEWIVGYDRSPVRQRLEERTKSRREPDGQLVDVSRREPRRILYPLVSNTDSRTPLSTQSSGLATGTGKEPKPSPEDGWEWRGVSPLVTIHEEEENLPESVRDLVTKADREGMNVPEPVARQIQQQLTRRHEWLDLDPTVREQYDIIYVTSGNPSPSSSATIIQQIIIYVQREAQRVYVLVPNTASSRGRHDVYPSPLSFP